jgi:hypothetical protein
MNLWEMFFLQTQNVIENCWQIMYFMMIVWCVLERYFFHSSQSQKKVVSSIPLYVMINNQWK